MTSTPSRTIVISDAKNAGPNAPAGRASSRPTSASTSDESGVDPRRQLLSLEARGQIAAQRVELDLQRPDLLRTATEQVALERLEIGHVDRWSARMRPRPARHARPARSTRRNPRVERLQQRSRITGRLGRDSELSSRHRARMRTGHLRVTASIVDRSVTPLALRSLAAASRSRSSLWQRSAITESGLAFLGHVADRRANRRETAAPARRPGHNPGTCARPFPCRSFEFAPVGVLGQPAALASSPGTRRRVAARRQRHADPVDHIGPRPHGAVPRRGSTAAAKRTSARQRTREHQFRAARIRCRPRR